MELNVIGTKRKVNLLTTLAYYGLNGMEYVEKEKWRDLIMKQEVYTPEELSGILDYCEKDVLAIEVLLPRMIPRIPGLVDCIKTGSKKKLGWSQALFRGRYMAATVRINAFLLSSSEENIEEDVRKLRDIVAEASRVVLNKVITCRTSVEGGIIPCHYADDALERTDAGLFVPNWTH